MRWPCVIGSPAKATIPLSSNVPNSLAKFRLGVWLVIGGYALWFVSALLSRTLPASHPEHAAAYAVYVSPWAITLVYTLALVEMLVAMRPLARGDRWAYLAALLPVLLVGIPRVTSDPRCFASLFSEHGCHTFLASMVLILVGLLLIAPAMFARRRA